MFGSRLIDDIYIKCGGFLAIPISASECSHSLSRIYHLMIHSFHLSLFSNQKVIDIFINKVTLSDLKIGALVSICVGYIFLILPENMYSDLRKRFCHETSQDYVETNSLTRRYRHSTLPSTFSNMTTNAIPMTTTPMTTTNPKQSILYPQSRTSNLSISKIN